MSVVGIILVSTAALIIVDIVMYIILGVIEECWEEKFEEDKDDNERGV